MAKIVAFVGIDGAGKTTVIDLVKRDLENNGFSCRVDYMGLGRDLKMPLLKRMMGAYSDKKYFLKDLEGKSEVRLKRDNYRRRGFFWLVVYYLELLIRYVRARFSGKDYVLMDRYFFDGLVFAESLNFFWLKLVIPKPYKCFLIHAPVEVIRKRKQEAEKKDIEKFYFKMRKVGCYFDVDVVDNTRDLNIVKNGIVKKIGAKNGK